MTLDTTWHSWQWIHIWHYWCTIQSPPLQRRMRRTWLYHCTGNVGSRRALIHLRRIHHSVRWLAPVSLYFGRLANTLSFVFCPSVTLSDTVSVCYPLCRPVCQHSRLHWRPSALMSRNPLVQTQTKEPWVFRHREFSPQGSAPEEHSFISDAQTYSCCLVCAGL